MNCKAFLICVNSSIKPKKCLEFFRNTSTRVCQSYVLLCRKCWKSWYHPSFSQKCSGQTNYCLKSKYLFLFTLQTVNSKVCFFKNVLGKTIWPKKLQKLPRLLALVSRGSFCNFLGQMILLSIFLRKTDFSKKV